MVIMSTHLSYDSFLVDLVAGGFPRYWMEWRETVTHEHCVL